PAPEKLRAVLNLLEAWSALVTFKTTGTLAPEAWGLLAPDSIPGWVHNALQAETPLRAAFTQPISVHIPSLLEGMLLLYFVAQRAGQVISTQLVNAPLERPGVYYRVIFSTGEAQAPYGRRGELENRFDPQKPEDWNTAVQLRVAHDLLAMNRAQFTLQNNKKTGQQALAAYFQPTERLAVSAITAPAAISTPQTALSTPSDAGEDSTEQPLSKPPSRSRRGPQPTAWRGQPPSE
ncbi:MAG: hypothetical protein HC915_18735, partial [Anaerolineae bacterium]|nr:hypothetical protein [Anaerolineae bacterium]